MSLLGLDIGSTGTKGLVFREDGRVIAKAYREYPMRFPRAGWVEIDSNEMWGKILDLLSGAQLQARFRTAPGCRGSVRDPITALSVSTFGEAFTPVDKTGGILFNTIYSARFQGHRRARPGRRGFRRKISLRDDRCHAVVSLLVEQTALDQKACARVYKKTDRFLFNEDMLFRRLGLTATKISYSL